MNILFLDLETTGLDPDRNRIIEIAAQLYLDYNGNRPIAMFHETLVYSPTERGEVSLGALGVNGAKFNEFTTGESTANQRLKEFADWLVSIKRAHKEFVVCGHNVHFDIAFLKRAFERLSIIGIEELIGHRYLDTASIALFLKDTGVLKTDKVNHKALAKLFSLPEPKHTAKGDSEITEQIYYALRLLVTNAAP